MKLEKTNLWMSITVFKITGIRFNKENKEIVNVSLKFDQNVLKNNYIYNV